MTAPEFVLLLLLLRSEGCLSPGFVLLCSLMSCFCVCTWACSSTRSTCPCLKATSTSWSSCDPPQKTRTSSRTQNVPDPQAPRRANKHSPLQTSCSSYTTSLHFTTILAYTPQTPSIPPSAHKSSHHMLMNAAAAAAAEVTAAVAPTNWHVPPLPAKALSHLFSTFQRSLGNRLTEPASHGPAETAHPLLLFSFWLGCIPLAHSTLYQ
ncbi:hypothetical protein PTSG_13173 [Salpingoeca rosetta]|uniref:Secreted protein n=1 Tax=Salpingoeca rosetta (strain ATCC 50818 / BSB-021) TaxID=946362 RepID=F2UT51_SALR5|nr:uncharacterized protein PTSG_13173 [Salpingoeca rosetta]EGD81310.1 hypothetical protein PTSG_13173 [Salpingoeca rosetta]|eukprot:XP_004987706.1 hypothetical protein PTSG_13173 [Salpingoeca rosetta]